MKKQRNKRGAKIPLVRKTWVEALFALGAMPDRVAEGISSHIEVKEAVEQVEIATRRLS